MMNFVTRSNFEKEDIYEVSLPWKTPRQDLPNNYELSLQRLKGLFRCLKHDKEQVQEGIVKCVVDSTGPDITGVHYLPHQAVIRKEKITTKLRVVYDASARSNGPSFNDCLHSGPKFDQRILNILLRSRFYNVAVTADIEKAFLMVSLAEDDREFLRFLRVDDPSKEESKIAHFVSQELSLVSPAVHFY